MITRAALGPGFVDEYARTCERAMARGTALMVGRQGVTREAQDRIVASAFGSKLAHLKAFARGLLG